MSEILTRTNAKTVNLDGVGGSGQVDLTSSEIAGMLHKAKPEVYFAGMCFIAGQYTHKAISQLLYKSIRDGEITFITKPFEDRNKFTFNGICELVCLEVFGGNVCKACNGTKNDETLNDCITCNGSGHINPTDSYRADYCQADNWIRWSPIYEHLYSLVHGWVSEASRLVSDEANDG